MKKYKAPLFFLLIFILNLQLITDPDVGWHIAVGKFIVENRQFPTEDLFSFSLPNYKYFYHSWASYVATFISYRFLGLAGVSILYSLTLTLSIYFLVKITKILYQKSTNPYVFIALTPLFISIAGARPRTFSFLFFTTVYFLFLKFQKENSKLIYLTPLIFLLWVNFHASFFVGIATFVYFILISVWSKKINHNQLKILSLITISSTLATLINPYGIDAWKQALSMSFSSPGISQLNIDWKPLISSSSTGWIFALLVTLTVVFSYVIKIKTTIFEKILLPTFFVSSLFTARFTTPLLVFLVPQLNLVFDYIASFLKTKKINLLPLKVAILSLFATVLLTSFANLIKIYTANKSLDIYSQVLRSSSPNKSLIEPWPYKESKFVVENFGDKNILTDANWSGYLLLLDPNIKVFYYGAMDNYFIDGKSFAFEYLGIINSESNSFQKLEKYDANIVLLAPQYPIIETLKTSTRFRMLSENDSAVIFEKISPSNSVRVQYPSP